MDVADARARAEGWRDKAEDWDGYGGRLDGQVRAHRISERRWMEMPLGRGVANIYSEGMLGCVGGSDGCC